MAGMIGGMQAGAGLGGSATNVIMNQMGQKMGESALNQFINPQQQATPAAGYIPQMPQDNGFSNLMQTQMASGLNPGLNFSSLLDIANR